MGGDFFSVMHRLFNMLTSKYKNTRLPSEVNRILFVRNLPFNITGEQLYGIFGKYGAIWQIRM